ncbi:MAG TPA: PqiA/YebS family transporter subunit [Stellaceae bacterium]|nr:PqiA/YebS family transporter subunit [Stellaceae bacterium]
MTYPLTAERGAAVDLLAEPALQPGDPVGCPDCGLLQHLPDLPSHGRMVCGRCDAVLAKPGGAALDAAMALASAGLVAAVMANFWPMMIVRSAVGERDSVLISGAVQLSDEGFHLLGLTVALFSVAIPVLWLLGVLVVLGSLYLGHRPRMLPTLFKLTEHLRAWAMPEIYLLGAFVAYTRLGDIAHIEIGPGGFALIGLAIAALAVDGLLDRRTVWNLVDRRLVRAAVEGQSWVECDACGLIVALDAEHGSSGRCPRCAAPLSHRKPHSLERTLALVLASTVLYIIANILPVMTIVQFGRQDPTTIIGGVRELFDADLWPLALLVFFASIAVPVLKLVCLTWFMIETHRRSSRGLLLRTRFYRITRAIGRWSNIDVFMISILTALIRFGNFTRVDADSGIFAFGAVVVLTMLAAEMFDPRLMWDATGDNP